MGCHYLTSEDLKNLSRYRYSGAGWTWLDTKLNPFWTKVTEWLPLWIAPNMLTLIALLFSISSVGVIYYFCPNLTEVPPAWAFLVSAFCIFMYQTLDAVDGKQARRTASSTPLGQLFDHGCDSLSAALISIALSCYVGIGINGYTLAMFITSQIPVLLANWHEIHGDIFFTANGNLGVTESQFGTILLAIIHVIFGRGIFEKDVYWISDFLHTHCHMVFQVKHFLVVVLTIPILIACLFLIPSGLKKSRDRKLAIDQLFFFFVWAVMLVALHLSGFFAQYKLCGYILISTAFCIYTSRLVIAASIKKRFAPVQTPLIPYYLLTAWYCLDYLYCKYDEFHALAYRYWKSPSTCGSSHWSLLDHFYPLLSLKPSTRPIHHSEIIHTNIGRMLYTALSIYIYTYFAYFVYTTIYGIANYLGIYPFSLKSRKKNA